MDQNKSEEVKADLVSLGFIPPETHTASIGASPAKIKNESDATPKLDRRLSINPLYQEPLSTGFTLSETPSISSDGYKPNLSISEVHAIGSYTPSKIDKIRKKFDDLEKSPDTPGKKTIYNHTLLKIGKEIAETFGNIGESKKVHDLVKKAETGTRANYKQLELEMRDHNLVKANPRITSTSMGAF